ncbi:MAG: formylmethanofuran dehydrogenase subunit C [Blastopirellula sp. JB062]
MPLTLTLLQDIAPSVDLRAISPPRLAPLALPQIAKLPLQAGNQTLELGELFRVQGDPADEKMRWCGDFSQCDYVAAEMTRGELWIEGSVGDHVGAAMRGGRLTIVGNAGDFVASPAPGEKQGLQGGSIVIQGNAGRELGTRMRRGMIAVAGNVGKLCGYRMLAGTIVIGGAVGEQLGLRMKRGTILALTGAGRLPATFQFDCLSHPPMIPLLRRELERLQFAVEPDAWKGPYRYYSGDAAEMSRGEILAPSGEK